MLRRNIALYLLVRSYAGLFLVLERAFRWLDDHPPPTQRLIHARSSLLRYLAS